MKSNAQNRLVAAAQQIDSLLIDNNSCMRKMPAGDSSVEAYAVLTIPTGMEMLSTVPM